MLRDPHFKIDPEVPGAIPPVNWQVVKVWFPANVIQMLVQAIGLGPYEFIPVLGFHGDALFHPMLKMEN